MNVVLDTNVVVSAMFWPGESRDCVVAWARRRFDLAVTVAILQEYDEVESVLTVPWQAQRS